MVLLPVVGQPFMVTSIDGHLLEVDHLNLTQDEKN